MYLPNLKLEISTYIINSSLNLNFISDKWDLAFDMKATIFVQ